MARQVFQLGAPTEDSPNVLTTWEGNYGLITSSLVDQSAEAYLRRFRVQGAGHVQIRTASSAADDPTDPGPEFTALLEAAAAAIVIEVGSLTLTLPGPDYPGNSFRDPTDPYFWTPPASAGVGAFVDAFANLTDDEKATTTLTLYDGVDLLEVILRGRAATGPAQASGRLVVSNPLQILLRGRATTGPAHASGRLVVLNPLQVILRGRAATGLPQASGRLVVDNPSLAADRARANIFGLSGRKPIYALEISHPDIPDNIRVVNDTQEVTIEGNTYVALAFRPRLPQEKEGEIRQAGIEVDNVGRRMVEWVEASNGGRGATMRIMELVVNAARVAEIVWEVPNLDVGAARMTNEVLSVLLVDEGSSQAPAVKLRHDPVESPGLF